MEKGIDDDILVEMVFKCLCKTLKNRKIYHIFKCFFGCPSPNCRNNIITIYLLFGNMKKYVSIARNTENPFMDTTSKEEILNKLKGLIGSDNIITKDNCNDIGNVQMRITQMINTFMHYCVESFVRNYQTLEQIGQETFDMVCKKIYGEDFVDETEKNIPEEVKRLIDAQREYSDSMGGMLDPRMLSRDSRFLEFLKEKGIIDGHGNRRRPLKMMPPTLERLEEPSNIEWYHPTIDWHEDDWEWEIIT